MPGFTSMLIRKCILNMRLMRRAAAKVFIYIKRLSTYIIRVITNERLLKKIADTDAERKIHKLRNGHAPDRKHTERNRLRICRIKPAICGAGRKTTTHVTKAKRVERPMPYLNVRSRATLSLTL